MSTLEIVRKDSFVINGQILHVPGAKIRAHLPEFSESKLIHLISIVDDHIIYKYYGKHKQWWHYGLISIEDLQYFSIHCDKSRVFKIKKVK